jgi:hypothetical protein
MFLLLLAAAALAAPAVPAAADEIVFKEDYGDGKKVECQIYKEDADYIHYIDIKKDQDAGCAREIVESITRGEKPLVDVEAFFKRKAAETKDKAAADAALAKAEEFRKAEEARKAAEKKSAEEPGLPKDSKLKMRPLTDGAKVVKSGSGGTPELTVDPFPEEDKTPPKPAKKPAEKATEKASEKPAEKAPEGKGGN